MTSLVPPERVDVPFVESRLTHLFHRTSKLDPPIQRAVAAGVGPLLADFIPHRELPDWVERAHLCHECFDEPRGEPE